MRVLQNTFFYKIKNKIILMILLATIPCILFSVYSSNQYYRYSRDMIIQEKDALLEEMTQSLNLQLQYYVNTSMALYYNNATRSYIDSGDYATRDEYVAAYLDSIVNSEGTILAAVMEIDGYRYISGYQYHNLDDYLERHREEVLEKEGKAVWIPTETMSARYHSNLKHFSMARAINSEEGTVGTLWLFFSSDLISDILSYERLLQEGTDYYVLSPDNVVICSNRDDLNGCQIQDENVLRALEGEQGTLANIIVTKESDLTGWSTAIVVDSEVAFREVAAIQRNTIILLVLVLVVIILIYLFLTRTIFKPINRLSLGMQKVSGKKFEKILAKNKTDEMGMLISSYNLMIDEIERLLKEVREEEKAKNEEKIKVLSMQINPHFVFNTLNTVKWMAISNKQPYIKRMIESLITLMRSVTYTRDDEIAIEDELKLLDSYVYIQKMRFVNFEVVYEVEENVKQLRILKLLLQPFVENCIIHAFQGKNGGIITIRIYRAGEKLHIFIEDNGCGFRMSSPSEIPTTSEKHHSDQVGIRNVQQRIQLTYGKEYTTEIHSEEGKGTRVHLILPVIVREEP